jgi:hypothetical protein
LLFFIFLPLLKKTLRIRLKNLKNQPNPLSHRRAKMMNYYRTALTGIMISLLLSSTVFANMEMGGIERHEATRAAQTQPVHMSGSLVCENVTQTKDEPKHSTTCSQVSFQEKGGKTYTLKNDAQARRILERGSHEVSVVGRMYGANTIRVTRIQTQ